MDLLLERRYNLDAMVTKKEQERRDNEEDDDKTQVSCLFSLREREREREVLLYCVMLKVL